MSDSDTDAYLSLPPMYPDGSAPEGSSADAAGEDTDYDDEADPALMAGRPTTDVPDDGFMVPVEQRTSVTDATGFLYLATRLTPGPADPDPTEALEIRWVPFAEALAMTIDGRITDAMSMLAIQRVALARLAGAAAGEATS